MKLVKTLLILFVITSCSQNATEYASEEKPVKNLAKGKLFIIGGGKRPASMIKELSQIANLNDKNYGIVLPMSSSEPDTSMYYAIKQFQDIGVQNVFGINFKKNENWRSSGIDSLATASLIYISGGDQNRFMDIIKGTPIEKAIKSAYAKGSVIAGTSAGAAVMSTKMITGNERKYPEYESTFRHIEKDNIELAEGLGLIESAIIDQHFVKRSRYNRLFSAVIENPDLLGIGIDESTAIVVEGDSARITGQSQVILMSTNKNKLVKKGELIGSSNISVRILLPNQKFSIYSKNQNEN